MSIALMIVGIIALLAISGGVGYFVAKKPAQKEEQRQEKQTSQQQQIQQEQQKSISEITEQKIEQPEAKDETVEWKTYKNEKYGFEVKYPKNYSVEEKSSEIINFTDYSQKIYETRTSFAINIILNSDNKTLQKIKDDANKNGAISIDDITVGSLLAIKSIFPSIGSGLRINFIKNNYIYEIGTEYPTSEKLLINNIIPTFKFIK